MEKTLQPQVWEQAARLRDSFHRASPFPHFVIDGFLDETLARRMAGEFPVFDRGRALDEYGRQGGKHCREDVRSLGAPFAEIDRLFSSQRFLDWMSEATGIPGLLYDADYYGGGTHENLHGQDLNVHIDFNYHPKQGWYRRLNVLIYLNPEWDESWGGSLELWRDPVAPASKNEIVRIAPLWNRMAVFETSERSWHGFETIRLPEGPASAGRRSFALYLYTRERPAKGAASGHSTVYFERPMPEGIEAGKILRKEDWDEVLRLTARRDDLLRSLYRRETQFSALAQAQAAHRLQLEDTHQRAMLDLQLEAKRLREGGARSAREGIVLHAASDERYVVWAGASMCPYLRPGFSLALDRRRKPREGEWFLAKVPGTDIVQLFRLVRAYSNGLLAWQDGYWTFFPLSAPLGTVPMGWDLNGVCLSLVTVDEKIPFRTAAGASAFCFLHRLKNRLFGRRKSRLLWELSVAYRKLFTWLGLQVSTLPPG